MTPRQALDAALTDMLDVGRRPVCASDPYLWTSSDRDDLEAAAAWCVRCELLDLCRAAGEHEDSGTWGGVVRDARARRRRRTA